MASSSSVSQQPIYSVGDVIKVASRTAPGENRPGGVGRVTKIDENGCVDVKYVLGGCERGVGLEYVEAYRTERSKRTIHGRCRRCGSLIVDCQHRQPWSSHEDRNVVEDDEEREVAERRRRLARSWRRAIVIESDSEEDDSDDSENDQPILSTEDDAWLDQPIIALKKNSLTTVIIREEKDDDAWLDRPIVLTEKKVSPKRKNSVPLFEDEINEIPRAQRLESVPFLAPEDDGESLPVELISLVPKSGAKASELSRVMRRMQRVCETKGLPQARRELSVLRLKAASLGHDTEADLDDFDEACNEVHALIVGGLRRRCVDVADACYRRLTHKQLSRKGAEALEAAALKQDQLDQAIKLLEQELNTVRRMGYASRGQNDESEEEDDCMPLVVAQPKKRAPRDNFSKYTKHKKKRRDHESCLNDIWGWELSATHRSRETRHTRKEARDSTNNSVMPQKESKFEHRINTTKRPLFNNNKKKKTKPNPLWDLEQYKAITLDVPKNRLDLVDTTSMVQYPCSRFALGAIRRVADKLAATLEGASSVVSVANEAVQVLLGAPILHLDWSCTATILACLDDARMAARYHDRAALSAIHLLELALLVRCSSLNHQNHAKEAMHILLQKLCTSDEHTTIMALARGDTNTRVQALAWRLVATSLNDDTLTNALASIPLKTVQLAVTALAASPAVQFGLDQVWPALKPKWLEASFKSQSELVAAIKAATAICEAGAGADEDLLWHLWQKATSQAEGVCELVSVIKVQDTALNRALSPLNKHRLALDESSLAGCVASLFVAFVSRRAGLRRRRLAVELLRRKARASVVANQYALPITVSTLLALVRAALLDADAAFIRGVAACFDAINNAEDDELIALAWITALSTTGIFHNSSVQTIAFDFAAKRELLSWLLKFSSKSSKSISVIGNAISLLLEHSDFLAKQRAAVLDFATKSAHQAESYVAARLAVVALQPELKILTNTNQDLGALRQAGTEFDRELITAILETASVLATNHRFEPLAVTALAQFELLIALVPVDFNTAINLSELRAALNSANNTLIQASAQARSLMTEYRQKYSSLLLIAFSSS